MIINKILSECHAGNSGNISLQFLTVNYTSICYFLLLKSVQLTAFHEMSG